MPSPGPLELQADEALCRAACKVRILDALRPVNEAEEKERFLAGKSRLPRFVYRKGEVAPTTGVERLAIPDSALGRLLEQRRRLILAAHQALVSGEPADMLRVTARIYGKPERGLVAVAQRLLRDLPAEPHPGYESTEEVAAALRRELAHYGFDDWELSMSDGDYTVVRPLERRVMLTPVGPVVAGTGRRLAVHEIGVHVLRSVNGRRQPLRLFAYGLPGYEATEEGLAGYGELVTNTARARTLRKYAARVLAVDSLFGQADFAETYELLLSLGQVPEQAWESSLRAHRGGGCCKDHIYLEGLFEVLGHVEAGGTLEPLFVGKVGLRHIPLIERLLAEGSLEPAGLLPPFLGAPADNPLLQRLSQLV